MPAVVATPNPPIRTGAHLAPLVRLALVLALASASACSGDGGGPVSADPSIAGDWSGSAKFGLVDFRATFTQAGDSVGGSGRFSSPIASSDFSVRGVVQGGDVSLVLTSATIGTTTFAGRFVAADRISGTLDRPDDDDLELTLDRR
jgi:hypothetical protein